MIFRREKIDYAQSYWIKLEQAVPEISRGIRGHIIFPIADHQQYSPVRIHGWRTARHPDASMRTIVRRSQYRTQNWDYCCASRTGITVWRGYKCASLRKRSMIVITVGHDPTVIAKGVLMGSPCNDDLARPYPTSSTLILHYPFTVENLVLRLELDP